MDLKKLFPISFQYVGTLEKLIIGLLIYLVGGAIGGALIGVIGSIKIIGFLGWILGLALDLYVVVGIVIQILAHLKKI